VTPSATRSDALGAGISAAPVADFGTSKVYGLGVGARLGYTHASNVYFGGTFHYHFGGSSGPMSYTLYYVGPEVGYNVAAGPVVVRPYLGGGFGSLHSTYRGTGVLRASGGGVAVTDDYHGASQSAFFWPGVTVLVPVTPDIAVGADARLVFAPGQDASTSTLTNNGVVSFANTNVSTPTSTALAMGLTGSYRF
jgi:hypothetical protein